ncbi:MAG: Smr/MutS family protein [Muribaculaceae bacterium]|nr:Smr/MutS family protein [Muribaculaceae bacterium]
MIYPENFEAKIQFDIIRREVSRRCISPMGKECCDQMRLSSQMPTVVQALEETHEMTAIFASGREFPLSHYHDLRASLKAISAPGTFIAAEHLFDLVRSLHTIEELRTFFHTGEDSSTPYPRLAGLARRLQPFSEIQHEIMRVLDKGGNVRDNASPILSELRRTLQSTTAGIAGTLRRIISQGREAGILEGDVQPSVRDGRLVIPVAPMHKRKLRGIVHDESASGKTIFIEPEEIVEANNKIRETEAEIAREIIRILTELTDQIRPHAEDLLQNHHLMGHFDFTHAKARFAQETGGQMPHVHAQPTLEWYHAVHPALFLSLREQGKEVVPLNIELNAHDRRLLIISGPNAGGKSVCLKTVGAVQYMMQCGLLPPLHDNSHMGIFESIFIDIGDQQSLEDDLSTYSSHLLNMKFFLLHGNEHSLLLIDEMGSGTEPQIGGAIAQALLGQFNEKRMMGVVTTHYQNLKHFAEETEGIINGAMLYDRGRMQPLFQLSVGYPGSSFAIEIARKIGMPTQVIDTASRIVGSDYVNMDRYLLDLVRDRKYWERKRHEVRQKEKRLEAVIEQYDERLEDIARQHRDIIRQAKSEAQEMLAESNAKIERTIREIRQMQAEKEKTKEVRRQLEEFKHRLESDEEEPNAPVERLRPRRKPRRQAATKTVNAQQSGPQHAALQAGDSVVLHGQNTVGTIISMDEKYAVVAFGMLKTRVETSRLERSNKKPDTIKASSISTTALSEIRDRQLHFKPDIDVRGMRADEALQAITYFMDDAIQFAAHRVRILHGTGTGALREVIRQYLNTLPGVRSYRDEHVQMGGAGITVVDLE